MGEEPELRNRAQRIEELLEESKSFDPNAQATIVELVQNLMSLHGASLARLMAIISDADPNGRMILKQLEEDELVSALLLLYGLHPLDLDTRLARGVGKLRHFLSDHGGHVELLESTGGVIRLKLSGRCSGCGESSAAIRRAIEELLYQEVPDINELYLEGEVEHLPRISGLVQLERAPSSDSAQQNRVSLSV